MKSDNCEGAFKKFQKCRDMSRFLPRPNETSDVLAELLEAELREDEGREAKRGHGLPISRSGDR